MSKYRVGTRVVIAKGSGLSSNKHGVIVPRSAVKTDGRGIPTNVSGAYRPIDWKQESAIMLDGGALITMFNDHIKRLEDEE